MDRHGNPRPAFSRNDMRGTGPCLCDNSHQAIGGGINGPSTAHWPGTASPGQPRRSLQKAQAGNVLPANNSARVPVPSEAEGTDALQALGTVP